MVNQHLYSKPTAPESHAHRITANHQANPPRNRKLHTHIPHVLRLNRLHREPQARNRRNLRPLHKPALVILHRARRLAKRDTPPSAPPQPNPAYAAQCACAMYLLM